MDDTQLLAMLSDLESQRVERKASIVDKDRICEAICAFANDLPNSELPGVVFIGANDDGSCADLEITDALQLTVADLRSNGNIYPFPLLTVEKRQLGGCEVVVVIVQPSTNPPIRFRGRTWVRIGPRRSMATPEEERRLIERSRWQMVPFDLYPVAAATKNDFNTGVFVSEYLPQAVSAEALGENDRNIDHQLAALSF